MEIATRIHQEAGISMVEASRLLEWILELIKTTLHSGESIMIAGFGKCTVRHKQARLGRHPHTGEAITISARRVVTCQASNLFKADIQSPATEGTIAEGQ